MSDGEAKALRRGHFSQSETTPEAASNGRHQPHDVTADRVTEPSAASIDTTDFGDHSHFYISGQLTVDRLTPNGFICTTTRIKSLRQWTGSWELGCGFSGLFPPAPVVLLDVDGPVAQVRRWKSAIK
jgi:hypothetical protein